MFIKTGFTQVRITKTILRGEFMEYEYNVYIFAVIPISVSVNKEEVINYINAGFSVAFMKAGEFKKMQKAYKEYV